MIITVEAINRKKSAQQPPVGAYLLLAAAAAVEVLAVPLSSYADGQIAED